MGGCFRSQGGNKYRFKREISTAMGRDKGVGFIVTATAPSGRDDHRRRLIISTQVMINYT